MTIPHEHFPDAHHDSTSNTLFGFWVYLLTDFMMFAALFATYAVLRNSTFGGPSVQEVVNLPFTLIQTMLLLLSSFTSGLGVVAAHRRHQRGTIALFGITFLFGVAFLSMQLTEFSHLIESGNSWRRSALLSAFFTLIGTHGLHMVFALLWIPVLLVPVWLDGLTPVSLKRLTCLKMFWQFLNVVWVFIFTMVYLMSVV